RLRIPSHNTVCTCQRTRNADRAASEDFSGEFSGAPFRITASSSDYLAVFTFTVNLFFFEALGSYLVGPLFPLKHHCSFEPCCVVGGGV
ncbi:hypothetical protein, partial [Azospirillum endophyticum]|uniref:hypothetical protein n=1 Tax=Azospirillum endophyticum TaxID=2800326 RepID=UPI001B3B9FEA